MGEPAELGRNDIVNMRALAQLVIDGVAGDTADPHEVIMRFATDHDIPIGLLLLQMAQFMKMRDEEFAEIVSILDKERTYD